MNILYVAHRLHPNYYDAMAALSRKHSVQVLVARDGHDNEKIGTLPVLRYPPSRLSLLREHVLENLGKDKVVFRYRFPSVRFLVRRFRCQRPDLIYIRPDSRSTLCLIGIFALIFRVKIVRFSQRILNPKVPYHRNTVYINFINHDGKSPPPPNFIPHCIDTSPQYPVSRVVRAPHEPLRIITVGKPIERKGGLVLIEAIARLSSEMDIDLSIYAGYAASQAASYLEYMNSYIAAHDLARHVRIMPRVAPMRMPTEYLRHHLFVYPGWVGAELDPEETIQLRSDGRSGSRLYSLIEAMRAGLPVVCSDDIRVVGAVANGRNGLLFRKRDPSDLAEKIRTIAGMDLSAMGACSRSLVESHYDAQDFPGKFEYFLNHTERITRQKKDMTTR